ncbi:hypothetical protein ACQ1RA_01535, partial [Ornithobacterium rhinotracheale]
QTAAFALDLLLSHTLAPSLRKTFYQEKRRRKKTLTLYKIPKNFSFISIIAVKLYYFQQKSLTMALGGYHSKAKT